MNVIQFLQPVNQGLRTVDRRSVLFRDLGKFVLGYKKGLREENTPAHDHTRPITMFTPTLKVSVVFRSTSRSLHSLDRFFRVGESVRASTRAALTRARSLAQHMGLFGTKRGKKTDLPDAVLKWTLWKKNFSRKASIRKKRPDFSFKVPGCT
jgi:hypothetical protein